MVKHFERTDFIAALYGYLNTIDLSEYDFKVERQYVLTESYSRQIEANMPFVARSLVHLLRRLLTESCEINRGSLVFFQPSDGPKYVPSGDLKVKRRRMFEEYLDYARKMNNRSPDSPHSYYNKLRELKLDITDVRAYGYDLFSFNLEELYQECIQRGYENGRFAIEGFQRENDTVDAREFDLNQF